jgi:hypothetical protein
MDGFSVTPEFLSAAASTIVTTLGNGDIGSSPTLTGGGAYGHAELGSAVTEFGSAVHLASTVLVKKAEDASAGLRDGAEDYARHEQRSATALNGAGTGVATPGGR